ncbi:MAG TPA: CopY family transcriptional regulator [Clostridiales bacterium]|nr:CopY family transcriptional regulator [Clostridiales bacterium]
MKKLSDNELEIMMAIWKAKEPVKSAFVSENMKAKGWAQTTITTFLSRLVEKGFLKCDTKGRTNTYTPIIAEHEYLKLRNKNYIERFYDSSVKNMVAELYHHQLISDEDLEELRQFIKDIDKWG